jgi:Zn-dependent protease with chaperone function
VSKRLPPPHATWLLSGGAVVAALSTLAVLFLLGAVLVGQIPGFAGTGRWSATFLRDHAETQPRVEAVALSGLLAAGVRLAVVVWRQGHTLLAAHRASAEMTPGPDEVVVIDEAPAAAVAVPGRPGRIVVARSLLAALSGRERRAVLAHERAHLAHRHHLHRSAVALAIAANPTLARLRTAIVYATERWADEDAAAELGNRRELGAILAQVALVTRSLAGVPHGLAAAEHVVAGRVAALLTAEAPRPRPLLTFALTSTLLLAAAAAFALLLQTEDLFEFAGHAYRATHGG